MFRNYLSTTLTNLLKDKLFSTINIAGLAIGLTACLLIGLYVRNELTYDQHWTKGDRLFRIVTTRFTSEGAFTNARNPVPLLPALRQYFAEEIEAAVRMQPLTREIQAGDALIQTRIMEVDSAEVARMFDFEVLAGSLDAAALEEPGGIALSTELAQQLFGRVDAVGEVLSVRLSEDTVRDVRVGAVYRLPQGNTILREGLLQLSAMMAMSPSSMPARWNTLNPFNYVLLAPEADGLELNARMREFIDRYVDIADFAEATPGEAPGDVVGFTLQNLSESYLNSPFDGYGTRGSKVMVLAFSAIALLVLAIGCINFIILSLAKAVQRAREVAIRKTIGASRRQLIGQYLGESLLVVMLAMVLAMALLELALPFFENVIGKNLDTRIDLPYVLLSAFTLVALVSLAGGFYPAFVLSHFRPAVVLKSGKSTGPAASGILHSVLVVFQFAVTIALLVSTFVIYAQVHYSINRDIGFNPDNLLFIEGVYRRNAAEQNLLKQRVAALPGVVAASLSGHRPLRDTGNSYRTRTFSMDGGGELPSIPAVSVDPDFYRTYQIPLVAGRELSAERDSPSPIYEENFQGSASQSNVIVNESMVRSLGLSRVEDAVGRQLGTPGTANAAPHVFTIVGVAGDTNFINPRDEPRAEVYLLSSVQGPLVDALAVRFQGEPAQLLPRLEEVWRSVTGDAPFSVVFMEQELLAEFAQERNAANVLLSFSLLAISIACLGLFGSAIFNVERRTKEIGVRKVLGAEVVEIVRLLLWQFSRPVMLANLIAWPVALWVMLNWLQRFTYRLEPWTLLPLCLVAGFVALCIAWVTVGGTAAKAASAKPVLALRYE